MLTSWRACGLGGSLGGKMPPSVAMAISGHRTVSTFVRQHRERIGTSARNPADPRPISNWRESTTGRRRLTKQVSSNARRPNATHLVGQL